MKSLNLAFFGTGYVGLVTGACLANVGHNVTCVDIDSEKIARLQNGDCPIFERDLPARIKAGVESGNLHFTTDAKSAIEQAEAIFIAVGTPTKLGSEAADLSAVFTVTETIRKHANKSKIVVQKSTVPPGTGGELKRILNEGNSVSHVVVSNPEFLKEGSAVADCERPDRVVIGTDSEQAEDVMRKIYQPFMRADDRMLCMSLVSAELVKVAANAHLAMRISFMNALTTLCERSGADIQEVRQGIGSDFRIGKRFLFPGVGFGGSCFPKDVRGLVAVMKDLGLNADLFCEIMNVNSDQRGRFIQKIVNYFEGSLEGKRIAIWGLAFKPGTDDVREAPSLDVVRLIVKCGGEAILFDAYARSSFQEAIAGQLDDQSRITYCDDRYQTLEGADALVILTDAGEFRSLDLEKLKVSMRERVIFDGRNLHDPQEMAEAGFKYFCIGRPYITPEETC